jgi:hypothetical protein
LDKKEEIFMKMFTLFPFVSCFYNKDKEAVVKQHNFLREEGVA